MAFCSQCGGQHDEFSKFCSSCGSQLSASPRPGPSPSAAASKPALEKQFLKEDGVTITNSRFIVDGQTYAMAGVTSVKRYRKDPDRSGAGGCVFIGALILLLGFIIESFGTGTAGVILGGIGVLWYKSLVPDFKVLLTVSSGEVNALESQDPDFVDRVISALNDAIVFRS